MVSFVLELLIRVSAALLAVSWICISTFVTIINLILFKSHDPTIPSREFSTPSIQSESRPLKHKRRVMLSLNPDSFILPPYLDVYRLEKPSNFDSSVEVTPTSSEDNSATFIFISTTSNVETTVGEPHPTDPAKETSSTKESRQEHRSFTSPFKSPKRFRAPSFRILLHNAEVENESSFSPTRKFKKSKRCKKQKSLSKLVNQTTTRMDRHAISHQVASMHDMYER